MALNGTNTNISVLNNIFEYNGTKNIATTVDVDGGIIEASWGNAPPPLSLVGIKV